jgi:hypothetical protein
MLKRDKLESLLKNLTDDDFAAIYKTTYGDLPFGHRVELVKDFVAEQYDSELDGCIAVAKSLLTGAPKSTPRTKSKFLPPR